MRYRLPATSLMALTIAVSGPAQAMISSPSKGPEIITDMVPGGDGVIPTPEEWRAHALNVLTGRRTTRGFTGPIDRSAITRQGYPTIPMGVAAATEDDTPLAWSVPGMDRLTGMARVRVISEDRVGSLIGSVSGTTPDSIQPGDSVFVAAGEGAGFNDGGGSLAPLKGPGESDDGGMLSGSGTATVTVTGAEILARAGTAAAPYTATTHPDQPVTDSGNAQKQADAEAQTASFTYAPLGAPARPAANDRPRPKPAVQTARTPAETGEAAASFATVITANGIGPNTQTELRLRPAADPRRVSQEALDLSHLNDFLEAEANGPLFRSVDPIAFYQRLLAANKKPPDPDQDGFANGRRRIISPSVAADPGATAERYLTAIATLVPHFLQSAPVEGFAIGKSGPVSPTNGQPLTTVVTNPITGQVLRGSGPLGDSLSLH